MNGIVTPELLKKVTSLRHALHQHPELSGQERMTALRIKDFLLAHGPDQFVEGLGGHGIAAVYDSKNEGPTVLLRADLDALPIDEVNNIPYRSRHQGVSHACGHDGHMAILAGVAMILRTHRPRVGRVVLLFQPEEENGQGAAKVLNDKQFRLLRPDYVFALHNLPGFKKNTVVIKEGPFAAASKGMIIRMQGKSSHAAHPEQGLSPVHMMTELIRELMHLPAKRHLFKDFSLLTIIHARLGDIAFGTNPGKATVMATLRTFLNDDMRELRKHAGELAQTLGRNHKIKVEIDDTEDFPATINDPYATRIVQKAIEKTRAGSITIDEPFRWSEDFGNFTSTTKGALFGIGSGKSHPSLHNHDYNFPDEILRTGISMMYHIADQIVNTNKNV